MLDIREKFTSFLESLKTKDSELLINAIVEGHEEIYGKPTNKDNPNPYVLEEIIEKPEPYYKVAPHTKQQTARLDPHTEKVLKEICVKFNLKPAQIKNDYLLFNQHLPINQYIKKLEELTEWKERGYYDNEEDNYYGLWDKKYAVKIKAGHGKGGNLTSSPHTSDGY
jgi:hypothetical protein